jgi:hypothetical protein
MREIVTHGRRERPTNYGDALAVSGGTRATIFSRRVEQASWLLVTIECVSFSIPAGAAVGDYRPMVHLKWGHGATDVETDIEVTYRQRFPVCASTLECEGFIQAFIFPGQAGPPPNVPAGATARFRAFVAEGVDGLPLYASRWTTQLNVAAGVLATSQARLGSIKVVNPAAAGGPDFFLLFDKATPPAGGDVPFDGAVLPLATAAGGQLVLPQGQTRAFVHGIAWGISSTLFTYTAAAVPVLVAAELET